jgi:polyisoprenyl-phosphate glycosyltransferase
VFERLSGTSLPEGAGDFRLLDRKAIDAMNRMRERVRFNKGLYAWMGFRSVGVPFTVPPRGIGSSRWRPRQLLRFGLDGIASFTTIPLRVWSYLGLIISAFAFFYALSFLIEVLVYGVTTPGFPTLIVSVLFFSGVQLISLGVIGEYLGRVYEEVKGRPLFLVAEEVGVGRAPAERPQAGEPIEPRPR